MNSSIAVPDISSAGPATLPVAALACGAPFCWSVAFCMGLAAALAWSGAELKVIPPLMPPPHLGEGGGEFCSKYHASTGGVFLLFLWPPRFVFIFDAPTKMFEKCSQKSA